MINVPFKIFPTNGYINSQIQIVCFDKNCEQLTIEKDGIIEKTINIEENKFITLTELKVPGIYRAKCSLNGKIFSQNFEIKNSIRFGNSELKSSFAFEGIPYSFFLMKDRLFIYDEANNNNEELFLENHISPTDIKKIDNNYLLFITNIKNINDEIVLYAIYSIKELKIVWELRESHKAISLFMEEKLLWVYNFLEKKIICYSLIEIINHKPTEIVSFQIEKEFKKKEIINHLFLNEEEILVFINLKNASIIKIKKEENIAIDNYGNYYKIESNRLICKNILIDDFNGIITQKPDILNLSKENVLFIGNKFIVDEERDFDSRIQTLIDKYYPKDEKGIKSFTPETNELFEASFICQSLMLSTSGVFVITKMETRKINSIMFMKYAGKWCFLPSSPTNINFILSFIDINANNELKTGLSDCTIIYRNEHYIILKTNTNVLILNRDRIIKEFDLPSEVQILPDLNHNNYLLLKSPENYFSLYSFADFSNPILKEVEILNAKFIIKHGVIWYSKEVMEIIKDKKFLAAFNLNQNTFLKINKNFSKYSIFEHLTDYTITEGYILTKTKILINAQTGAVKDVIIGDVFSFSENLDKIILRRGELIYLCFFERSDNKYELVQIKIANDIYKEAYLSPNGKFLILNKTANEYSYLDIETGKEINYFAGKFLAFSKEGNLILEDNNIRAAKIIDPLTNQDITPTNYCYYRFISPDGQLYSQVSTKKRYIDKIRSKEIDLATVIEYKIQFDFRNTDENMRLQVLKNRKLFFDLHSARFRELEVNQYDNICSDTIIKTEQFIEIGIVGTNIILELNTQHDLVFFNYGAFSYDNKYFGYAGKPNSNGLIHIFKLNFDSLSKTLELEDEYISTHPRWASWVCGFSKTGYFATYDSTPDTYIIKITDKLFINKYPEIESREGIVNFDYEHNKVNNEWREIIKKNFLCFSPSGDFLALSEQGYDPITLGGYGHQESGALHIMSTVSSLVLASFTEHGERIVNPTTRDTIFVAFSDDESKIMSMSKDGVVIVRNIDLKNSH